jgi:hypothetical protein
MDVPLVPTLRLVGAPGRSPLESAQCTTPTPGCLDSASRTIAIFGESSSNPALCPDVANLLCVSPLISVVSASLSTDLSLTQAAPMVPALTAAGEFSSALVPMIGMQDSQPDRTAPGVSSLDPVRRLSMASSDLVSLANPAPTAVAHMTRLQPGIQKPKKFNDDTFCYAYLATSCELYTIHEALSVPQWKSVMQDEYDALLWNKTWQLVPPQPSRNLIDCK